MHGAIAGRSCSPVCAHVFGEVLTRLLLVLLQLVLVLLVVLLRLELLQDSIILHEDSWHNRQFLGLIVWFNYLFSMC